MISVITPIYRDEQSIDLNNRIEELLSNYEMGNEGINERLADLTLDPTERRVKTDAEITPVEQAEIAILREHQMVLDKVIDDLKGVIYSGYNEIPLNNEITTKPSKRYLKREQIPEYMGKNVKPLILDGMTNQQDIADKLDVPSSTISYWAKKGYGMYWRDYVNNIINGVF